MADISVKCKFAPGDQVSAIVELPYPVNASPEVGGEVHSGDALAIYPFHVPISGEVWAVAPLLTPVRTGPEESDIFLIETRCGIFRVPGSEVYASARQATVNAQERNEKLLRKYAFTLKQFERHGSCSELPPPTDGDTTDGDLPDEFAAVVPEEEAAG